MFFVDRVTDLHIIASIGGVWVNLNSEEKICMNGLIEFILAGLKSPREVSTIFPTGDRIAERLTEVISDNSWVVELGVGSGAITEFILKHISDRKRYLGFEINQDLLSFSRKKYPDLKFVDDSALNLQSHLKGQLATNVISTLPWSLLPSEVAFGIVDAAHASLEEGGIFSTYLAANVLWTPAAVKLQKHLVQKFRTVESKFEYINIPPARVFICKK
jgi:phosphatidylethanolamine/phosphatidyl-N-methylethanolamine N-methyltransferase